MTLNSAVEVYIKNLRTKRNMIRSLMLWNPRKNLKENALAIGKGRHNAFYFAKRFNLKYAYINRRWK